MRIGSFDTSERVLVIAEIGNNHEGSVGRARSLVEEAAAIGVDAVKFQTFRTEHYVSRSDEERFQRLERFRLTESEFIELAELAHRLGVLFISTAFDLESGRFLADIADCVKAASADNDFYPLLDVLARTNRPLIVSTGLADLEQLERTASFVESARGTAENLAFLHCVSSYPVPEDEINLRAIGMLAERFPSWTVGYSDHTLGMDAAVLSVVAGARIIEKHFTLDKQASDFRDHQLSADPPQLRELLRRIRAAETLAGRAEKVVQPSEKDGGVALRRSIIAARDLRSGQVLADADITWVRPGGGLPPGEEHLLLNKTLTRDVAAGERLDRSDVR